MKLLHWILVILTAAVLLVLSPAVASAAVTYSDSVSGYEVYATSTEGTFVGQATGALPGYWATTVVHTPLSPDAVVTGGDFSVATTLNGTPTLVGGDVTGGSVIRQNPGDTGCVNQYYGVDLVLGGVGPGGSGSGSGTFGGTLVHRRTFVLGRCITYAATINGSLTVTF